MKVTTCTPDEIAIMREGGIKLSQILSELIAYTKVGLTLIEIDRKAQELIKIAGGKPGFMTVEDYRWATCININDGVVHGIPNQYQIQDGDVVSIDVGILYQGWHTDMSYTFQVQSEKLTVKSEEEKERDKRINRFLQAGKESLNKAIGVIKPGRRIGDISQAMQQVVEQYGYHCVDNLTGHGIGRNLHEYPSVPCMVLGPIEMTPVIKENMTLAIEVIYVEGNPKTYTDPQDGWTIRTTDGKMAAVFEKTIAVSSDGSFLLTP